MTFEDVQEIAEKIIQRYEDEQVDAVYMIFNEFKSMIAQRLVVERILPVPEIGERDIAQAEELSQEERKRALEAAKEAGVGLHGRDTTEIDKKAAQFGTSQVDYIYEQPPHELFASLAAEVRDGADLPLDAGIGGCGTRGAHDGDGFGNAQCRRDDRFLHAGNESRTPGSDYQGNYRDRQRSGSAVAPPVRGEQRFIWQKILDT